MESYIKTYGRPQAIYSDRHTIFKSPKGEEGLHLTQFGKAMKELEIELIHANSPQAKGRVERSHGILQDRLIKMMRLEGISSIEEGNVYIEKFREDYNKRFGKIAHSKENAHRELPKEKELERILCRKETRRVSKALEVQYKGQTYQIEGRGLGRQIEGAKVMVIEQKEGVRIEFKGKELKYRKYGGQRYQGSVLDRKQIDAFLDRKQPMSQIERKRKGRAVNF
jgi:hypothetical protein